MAKMRVRAVAAAVTRWRHFAAEARKQRMIVARVLNKMSRRVVSQALDHWYETAEEAKAARVLVKRSLGKIMSRVTAGALEAWRSYVSEKRRKLAAARRALGRMASGETLLASFAKWLDLYKRSKAELDYLRHKVVHVERMLLRINNRFIAEAWTSWETVVSEEKRLRRLLARASQRMHKRDLSTTYWTW
jgi:ABC-type multidrug transport system fused ATPase/permease subunit